MDELKLLEHAVNIEDLTQQKTLLQYTILNVQVIEHRNDLKSFKVREELLPPFPKETSLCLIPMSKYKAEHINKEDDCIFAMIEEVRKSTIEFSKRSFYDRSTGKTRGAIDTEIKYAVRFVPNRITHRASITAVKKIREYGLQNFFTNFGNAPYKNDDNYEYLSDSSFVWENANIGNNKEQKIAIKNIVKGTAFPFPYLILGPPGKVDKVCNKMLN